MTSAEMAASLFLDLVDREPEFVVRSPGRVNLIGDHTDYNDGFAMPLAIDRDVSIALAASTDGWTRVYSEASREWNKFHTLTPHSRHGWPAYVQGVAHELSRTGNGIAGWTGTIASSVPTGAGLSSSAALELAVARAYTEVSGWMWNPLDMALLAQRAENSWVGMRCGLLDQVTSAFGREGHALMIDFRSLDISYVAMPDSASVVILDTTTRHTLVDGEYNNRRSQCESAAGKLGVQSLRDVTTHDLRRASGNLLPAEASRVRHVITENERVIEAAKALSSGDLARVGELMTESHRSLAEDYEVSTPEIDAMAGIAATSTGCFGARMTGGGFGGSVVALVDREAVRDFGESVLTKYRVSTGLEGIARVAVPSIGTSTI